MMTSSGPQCDVHGGPILGLREADAIHPFTVNGIEGELHACTPCRGRVEAAFAAKDWHQLPDGPLRELYAKAEADGSLVR